VFGCLGGKDVVLMRGRFHFYEGYTPAQVALPVRAMAGLGVKILVVTNAAGGVNREFQVGDLMVIRDHIGFLTLAGVHPLIGPNDSRFGPRFPPMSHAYSKELYDVLLRSAEKCKSDLKLRTGTYFAVAGPTFETPAEIGMMRILKADAVGMSTVFEVIAAAHCGLKVLGISLITNRCKGPGDDEPAPSHEEVLKAAADVQPSVQKLVSQFVADVDVQSVPLTPTFQHFSKIPSSL